MEFLKVLVEFLSANGVLPAEITPQDDDRSKTYLQSMPDTPAKAYCVTLYDTSLPSIHDKQAGVYRIQVIMRNPNHTEVFQEITNLWKFLINRPDYIEEDIGQGYYAIIDCTTGPLYLGKDEHGNHRYSLNFPVKSKTF